MDAKFCLVSIIEGSSRIGLRCWMQCASGFLRMRYNTELKTELKVES